MMDDGRIGDSNLVQIEATVMRQTQVSLLRNAEETELTIDEVIDRLALHMKPTRPELALLPADAIERIQDAAKEKKKQLFGEVGKDDV